jgi:hypothetical protein
MREDITLLLNTQEMGELVRSSTFLHHPFYKFLPKLGMLRHLYLDFENLHALVFPLPDRNTLLVGLEKMEQDVPHITRYIINYSSRMIWIKHKFTSIRTISPTNMITYNP